MSNFINQLNEVMLQVQKYAPSYLKEVGTDVKGDPTEKVCCLNPDHPDRNPSMHWWKEARVYHCFSCGSVYNIFKIANKYENKPMYGKSFITDNVFYLANKYGVAYEHINVTITNEDLTKMKQYQAIDILYNHVKTNINEEYLNKRQFTKETALKFGIGSVKWDRLFKEYQDNEFEENFLLSLGISKTRLNENKLVIMIKDNQGRPCSFVSREMKYERKTFESLFNIQIDKNVYKDQEEQYLEELSKLTKLNVFEIKKYLDTPKYNNGKESLIYNKSEIIFGFSEVKDKISVFNPFYILEGYADMITAYQAGLRNIGALGSASFTDEHIAFLESSPYVKKIAVALDNDKVGKARTKKLIDRITSQTDKLDNKYFVAHYKEEGKDLDEIINHFINEKEEVDLEKIFDTKTIFEYSIENLIDEEADDASIVEKVLPTILQEDDYLKRADMVKELCKYISTYSEDTLIRQLNYMDDYQKKGIAKKYERIIDQHKELILREPKNASVILESLESEIQTIHSGLYGKEMNMFDRTLKQLETAEEKKSVSSNYKLHFDMDLFDECTIRSKNVITLCGRANSFKTTFFVNLTVKILKNNPNAMVYFLTTDDSVEKLNNDFIACIGNIPRTYCIDPLHHPEWGLNESLDPQANKFYKIYLDAFNKLTSWVKNKRLVIAHTSDIGSYYNVERSFKEISEDKDLKDVNKIGIIDSLNNIECEDHSDERQQLNFLSMKTKALAAKYDFTLFMNVELKKIGDFHKVSKSDLRGSVKLEYDCDLMLVGNNNLHNLKGETGLSYKNAFNNEQPIVTLEIEKSKVNGHKFKPYYHYLDGDFNQFHEIKPSNSSYHKVDSTWYEELELYNNISGKI
ncbi:MAG: toprim domain-containing protein [Cetobacterium sp.]